MAVWRLVAARSHASYTSTRDPTGRRGDAVTSGPGQTAAAIAARRQQTQDKLTRVEKAITRLRRERGRIA